MEKSGRGQVQGSVYGGLPIGESALQPYYADEEARHRWANDWPNDAIPEHEAPTYDRDRHLPARDQAAWQNCRKQS